MVTYNIYDTSKSILCNVHLKMREYKWFTSLYCFKTGWFCFSPNHSIQTQWYYLILSDLVGTPLKNADAAFFHAKKSYIKRMFQALKSLYNFILGSLLGPSHPGYPKFSEYKSLLPLKSLLHCSSQIFFVFLVCSLSGHIQVYR